MGKVSIEQAKSADGDMGRDARAGGEPMSTKERPIPFSGAMIRAILTGTKTQTRQIVNPQPAHSCRWEMNGNGDKALHLATSPGGQTLFVPWKATLADHRLPCPYGTPGDRLWVRETWALENLGEGADRLVYMADRQATWLEPGATPYYLPSDYEPARWRPSIYMPRSFSRITLEVTETRIERVWDITEADARAEGIQADPNDFPERTHRVGFSWQWDQNNGKRAPWSANPWVWVVKFKLAIPAQGAKS
jgi:hypothetical protein